MFEDRTYENLVSEALAAAPTGVDIRQGSIYYDAVAGNCLKIAQYYADMRHIFDLVFVSTAVDEYLDEKGMEFGVYRNQATKARYKYHYEGSRPSVGERFFTNGKYFKLYREDGAYYLEAEDSGQDSNDLALETPAVPVNNISGLTVSTFGEIEEPGTDIEDDEDYRQRIREKIAGPAENGNRQHYKTWCEEDTGVGRARIIPLFAGENTVMGVILGTDGHPAADPVVDRVQEYVDPATMGLQREYNGKMIKVGDGLGDGVANIGAHFAAVPADGLSIDVSFNVTLSTTATLEQAVEEATEAVSEHLRSLALSTPDGELIIVRISTVGALIHALPSVIDYSDLTFNGETANIEVGNMQVAVLGEVVISAAV